LAVKALRAAKGRDAGKPLSLHISDPDDIGGPDHPVRPLSAKARRLIRTLMPGPVTVVLPDLKGGTRGFRCPDSAVTRAVLRQARCPVVASSVNLSGEPPATTGSDAAILMAGKAALVLDTGPSEVGKPSTVVSVDGDEVTLLREGALTEYQVLEAASSLRLFVCTGNICRSPLAEALARLTLAEANGCGPADLPRRGLAVLSAGTAAVPGRPCPEEAVAEGRQRGVDLSRHRSQPLIPALLDRAETVFVMDRGHRTSIMEFAPESADNVVLLDPAGRDIPDPYGCGAEAYERAGHMISQAIVERFSS
ncbi:MAG: Sua5/YciO/YrdC/YwlC family protein, partial [Planctomycetota bacterium]